MMGTKTRSFSPLPDDVSLEDLARLPVRVGHRLRRPSGRGALRPHASSRVVSRLWTNSGSI